MREIENCPEEKNTPQEEAVLDRILSRLVGRYEYFDDDDMFTLNGGEEPDARLTFLTNHVSGIERKMVHISELRQKNLNYSLLIFAGLSAVTLSLKSEWYSICVPIGLLVLMYVFCRLDRQLHAYIHGWGATKRDVIRAITEVINDPSKPTEVVRYAKSKERAAELRSLMPAVFYCLVLGSGIMLVLSIIRHQTG